MNNRNEELAYAIYNWCKKNNLWGDNIIYFNGKALAAFDSWHRANGEKELGKQIAEDLYEYENRNVNDYFEYVNPYAVSMSFEGPLYNVLNGYTPGWIRKSTEFEKVFEKHGMYFEQGDAWNLSAYEL